jgi:hypothetical protein
MKNKLRQIKSSWYYVFWGTMAVAVVGGQIYVGSGYREMAEATKSSLMQVTCLPQYTTPSTKGYNRTGEFE